MVIFNSSHASSFIIASHREQVSTNKLWNMSKFRLLATALLVVLCTGFYSCGGDDEKEQFKTTMNAELYVKEAGTLHAQISDDIKFSVSELSISGNINGDDIALIREMAGCDANGNKTEGILSKLSLNTANIVTGGSPYYFNGSTAYHSKANAINGYMFHKCNSLKHLELPRETTRIEMEAFTQCEELTSVIIGEQVEYIGINAFCQCTNLTSIIIPNKVEIVDFSAFAGCEKLASITIGSKVTGFGMGAFFNCTSLKEIHFLSQTPPKINSNDLKDIDKQNCKLYVPINTASLYKVAEGWKEFVNITEE